MADHLGNVRAVFVKTSTGTTDFVVFRDYYPFGMEIGGRNYTDAQGYRYGYQGKYAEKDPETGWNAFELRMYDSRIGRWLTVDPEGQYYSPYVGMGNDPVNGTDPTGGLEDWYWDYENQTVVYDPSITTRDQFDALVNNGLISAKSQYIGAYANEVKIMRGSDVVGRLNLGENGSYINLTNAGKWDNYPGRFYSKYEDLSPNGLRTWGVEHKGTPWSISVGGEFTFGAGGGLEIGYFKGNYDKGFYNNTYAALGLNVGGGLNVTKYVSNNGPITIGKHSGLVNISGEYFNATGGVQAGPISMSYSQGVDRGGNYKTYSSSASRGFLGLGGKIGYSTQFGHTNVIHSW